jgi:hypothetical protein
MRALIDPLLALRVLCRDLASEPAHATLPPDIRLKAVLRGVFQWKSVP